MSKKEIGDLGEALAAKILEAHGHQVLDRNYRCPDGEMDLISLERGGAGFPPTLVFTEVKTRGSDCCGRPAEAVDRRKLRRLRRTASSYLQERGSPGKEIRFDVIEITVNQIRGIF